MNKGKQKALLLLAFGLGLYVNKQVFALPHDDPDFPKESFVAAGEGPFQADVEESSQKLETNKSEDIQPKPCLVEQCKEECKNLTQNWVITEPGNQDLVALFFLIVSYSLRGSAPYAHLLLKYLCKRGNVNTNLRKLFPKSFQKSILRKAVVQMLDDETIIDVLKGKNRNVETDFNTYIANATESLTLRLMENREANTSSCTTSFLTEQLVGNFMVEISQFLGLQNVATLDKDRQIIQKDEVRANAKALKTLLKSWKYKKGKKSLHTDWEKTIKNLLAKSSAAELAKIMPGHSIKSINLPLLYTHVFKCILKEFANKCKFESSA